MKSQDRDCTNGSKKLFTPKVEQDIGDRSIPQELSFVLY